MTAGDSPLCWICRARPAEATNRRSSAAKADALEFPCSVCSHCSNTGTRGYDEAWSELSNYLHTHWRDIVARGSFDLSKVFGVEAAKQSVRVQLHFVKLLGCKLLAAGIRLDFGPFSRALMEGTPHPQVTLLVASSLVPAGRMLSYESDVSVLRNGDEVHSAVWMNLVHPVAIKVCYLKAGAPIREPPGFPWHPARQRKIVKLSPYKGDAEPLVARRDLRI